MSNPYRRPWLIDAAGQLRDATGEPLALIRPQTSPAVRDLIERAPLQDALLTTFAQQLEQAHSDETELLDICEAAIKSLKLCAERLADGVFGYPGHAEVAIERLETALSRHRGEEAPSC